MLDNELGTEKCTRMRAGLGETGREKDEGWPPATQMETMGNKQANWRRELGTIRPAK